MKNEMLALDFKWGFRDKRFGGFLFLSFSFHVLTMCVLL